MAKGVPVIATDVGGISEALDDCGLLLPRHQDFDQLSQALGSQREFLQGAIAKFDLETCVSLLGQLENVARLLDGANIFVFPSESEGLPWRRRWPNSRRMARGATRSARQKPSWKRTSAPSRRPARAAIPPPGGASQQGFPVLRFRRRPLASPDADDRKHVAAVRPHPLGAF